MTARPEDIRNAAWAACDTFRGAIDADQYRHYVLVMLFLKYISDQWEAHAADYRKQYKDMPEATRELRVQRDMARERFALPEVTLYDKDEMGNLSADEKKALKRMLKAELEARR